MYKWYEVIINLYFFLNEKYYEAIHSVQNVFVVLQRQGCSRLYVGFDGYSRCVSRELHLYMRELAAHSRSNKFFL